MIIICENCKTKFNLPDEKIPPKGAKVRCTKCNHSFFVKKEEEKVDAEERKPEDELSKQIDEILSSLKIDDFTAPEEYSDKVKEDLSGFESFGAEGENVEQKDSFTSEGFSSEEFSSPSPSLANSGDEGVDFLSGEDFSFHEGGEKTTEEEKIYAEEKEGEYGDKPAEELNISEDFFKKETEDKESELPSFHEIEGIDEALSEISEPAFEEDKAPAPAKEKEEFKIDTSKRRLSELSLLERKKRMEFLRREKLKSISLMLLLFLLLLLGLVGTGGWRYGALIVKSFIQRGLASQSKFSVKDVSFYSVKNGEREFILLKANIVAREKEKPKRVKVEMYNPSGELMETQFITPGYTIDISKIINMSKEEIMSMINSPPPEGQTYGDLIPVETVLFEGKINERFTVKIIPE